MHATSKMGFPSNCGVESHDKKTNKVNIFSSPQPKQRKKLGSILNLEEYEGDSHPQAVKDAEKSRGFHQKQNAERKPCKSEEVVRYMSCLPNYLERGENPKEKPFNIGVLDWSQLEKWQHNGADVFGINADPSTSTSNSTSLNFSKVSSSNLSSDSTLSHHHRNLSRPSTSNGGRSKFVSGSGGELPEQRTDPINLLRVQQNLLQATQSSNHSRSRPSETDSAISGNGTRRKEQASTARDQVPVSAMTGLDYSERGKTTHFAACHQSDSSEGNRNGSLEENQFHGRPEAKVCCDKSSSEDNRCSSTVRDSGVERSFIEVRSLNCSSGQEQTIACTQSVSIGPSRRKNVEKKNSDSKPRNLARDEILRTEVDTWESTKIRNPSPTRRFSFGISRIGKSSNSNSSEVLPDSKLISTSACSNSTSGGKSNATSRARSSPLRRLLDPLLKPKSGESREFAQSSDRNPSSRERSSKPSRVQIESPALALLSAKEAVDLKGCRSHHTQKNGASSKQALLQIAVKNGLPLFTFTVDNCRDILAATVKSLRSSKENMGGWIYTFFSFTEMKKKHTQWINQGSKDRNHGFVSNIVAMMKVSDVFESDSTGKGLDRSSRREFVLSAVGPRGADLTADTLPCNELAAIVVKYPEAVCKQSNRGLKEPFPRGIDCEEGNECGSEIPFSTTVILPGGHHGVPSKGEPSPLIKRWKTGGSCDCGGWDLGCQLTILSSNSNSIKSQSTAVRLFSRVTYIQS